MAKLTWLGRRAVIVLSAAALFLSSPNSALANGGTIQLANSPVGPYFVTVMTSPSPLRVGTADVSVLVTRANQDDVIEDATVFVDVQAAASPANHVRYPATHDLATNRLFYAANVPFPTSGQYVLTIAVTGTAGTGNIPIHVNVDPSFLGFTITDLACTAVPISGLIAFLIFGSRSRNRRGMDPRRPE
jgi:hypothetical protein